MITLLNRLKNGPSAEEIRRQQREQAARALAHAECLVEEAVHHRDMLKARLVRLGEVSHG